MNKYQLTPRPTRSTLRNRRIVMDLKAGINGSYVGQEGLKGSAQLDLLSSRTERSELYVKVAAAVLMATLGLFLAAVL